MFAGEEKFQLLLQQQLQQWYLVVSYSGMRGSLPGCLLSSSSGAERLGLLATGWASAGPGCGRVGDAVPAAKEPLAFGMRLDLERKYIFLIRFYCRAGAPPPHPPNLRSMTPIEVTALLTDVPRSPQLCVTRDM
jgi:hypothetical protein